MELKHAAYNLAEYAILTAKIDSYIKVYSELIPKLEKELKQAINDDDDLAIIRMKENFILELSAKIEILNHLK